MTEFDYTPPVSGLLTLGDCREMRQWPDYLGLEFTTEHVPELIRLAQEWSEAWWDRTDDIAVWGPVHAWRVLGKLRAESAIEPLVGVIARTDELDEDWIMEELPGVLGMIGPLSIPILSDALADSSLGLWTRITTAHSLECVGNAYPEGRDDCIAALTRTLTRFSELAPTLNAFLISYLVDLKAIEAAPLMEQAFAADTVDWSVLPFQKNLAAWRRLRSMCGSFCVGGRWTGFREQPRWPSPGRVFSAAQASSWQSAS
jgi:hypothetical protein